MNSYHLSEPAQSDLDDIWIFIAGGNPLEADRFIDRMFEKFELLALFPKMGNVDERFGEKIHIFPEVDYLIFYREEQNTVKVLRIVSRYQDLSQLYFQEQEEEG